MSTRASMFMICVFFTALLAVECVGAVPTMVSYQGKLTDAGGNPLTGTYDLTFAIYNDEKAGSLLWTETQNDVSVNQGIFTVLLGSVTPLPDSAFTGVTYLQTTVGSTILTPRVRIVSAGYALRAKKAEEVVTPVSLSDTIAYPGTLFSVANSGNGSAFRSQALGGGLAGEFIGPVYVSGDLGIGVPTPLQKLDVAGTAQMTGFKLTSSPMNGYVLQSDANGVGTWQADGIALPFSAIVNSASDLFWLRNSGSGKAVYANTQGAGDAVYALASGTGNAGTFSVNNTGSGANALHASSNGSGSAVNAINTGTGRAGYFQINNGSSSANALYVTTNGSGNAISATAAGSGKAGSFGGDVYISGELTFPAGRPTLPIAYGIINSDGSKRAGTSNVTSSWDAGNSCYVITIAGESYSNLTHVAIANVVGLATPRIALTSSSGTDLVVTLYSLSSAKTQGMFDFVVYEP